MFEGPKLRFAKLEAQRELKNEILKLDNKLNQAFKYLLDKIDALHQKPSVTRKPVGYKIKINENNN